MLLPHIVRNIPSCASGFFEDTVFKYNRHFLYMWEVYSNQVRFLLISTNIFTMLVDDWVR